MPIPRKRVCSAASRRRTVRESHSSDTDSDNTTEQHQNCTISATGAASRTNGRENRAVGMISRSGRSGRAIRLPTRFKE